MGMPLYGAQPPTGYSMKADTWVSSSALLNRMNFALALTAGKVRGVKVDAAAVGGIAADRRRMQAQPSPPWRRSFLASDVSKQTHDSIVAQVDVAIETVRRRADNRRRQGLRSQQTARCQHDRRPAAGFA